MEVSAIHSHKNPKKGSYLQAGLLGGLTGFALKYAIPVTRRERDGDFRAESKDFLSHCKEACSIEAASNKTSLNKNPNSSAEKLLKLLDNFQPVSAETDYFENNAKKLTEFVDNSTFFFLEKSKVKKFLTQVLERAKSINAKNIEFAQNCVDLLLKHKRPTAAFVIPGILAGVIGTTIYNINQRISDSV